MKILALDTSGQSASVAILRDGLIGYEAQLTNGLTHSQCIMPMVDQALTALGMTSADMDLFAVVVGPGSFTGVRIGVSTVKALAHATGKPCIGIDALETLAFGAGDFDGLICPILDARAQQVYGAVFRQGETPHRVMDDVAMKLVAFMDEVDQLGEPLLFLGDGARAFKAEIVARLGDKASFAPAHMSSIRAGSAVVLAHHYIDQATDYLSLMPLYLRAPQAERERAAREAAKHE